METSTKEVTLNSLPIICEMGFNRILSKEFEGVQYIIKANGRAIEPCDQYKCENENSKVFIEDVKNLANNANVNKIQITNLEFEENQDLIDALSLLFSNVQNIELNNIKLPNLIQAFENISNKEIQENITIKNCGLNIQDFNNLHEYTNLNSIYIGQEDPNFIKEENKALSIWGKLKELAKRIPIINKYFEKEETKLLPEPASKTPEFKEEIKVTSVGDPELMSPEKGEEQEPDFSINER